VSATVAADERETDSDRGGRAAGDERGPAERPRRRWRALIGLAVLLAVVGGLVSAPWWGPDVLSRLAYFRVRRIVIDGARYATAAELQHRMGVDTTWSVWTDRERVARRLRAHPLVADARVERRLPGTLHAIVVEKVPVALAAVRDGFVVYDSAGERLPIEPGRVGGVDAPVIAARDTSLLRLLASLRGEAPRLFERVSEARRVDRDEIILVMVSSHGDTRGATVASRGPTVVRAMADVTAERLADLVPVEADLARRRARVAELDLRFRDQVIARLQ
jgi:cell division protein FtsQ